MRRLPLLLPTTSDCDDINVRLLRFSSKVRDRPNSGGRVVVACAPDRRRWRRLVPAATATSDCDDSNVRLLA